MSALFCKNTPDITLALIFASSLLSISTASADDRDRYWGHDSYDHHHRHFYPAFGYRVGFLPPGYLSLDFGGRRLFFSAGVWYELVPGGYIVVNPPAGIVIPTLPPEYTTVYVGGIPYYAANNIYYAAAPGGYVVTNPPGAGANYIQTPVTAAPAPTPQTAPAPPTSPIPESTATTPPGPQPGMWYYCASANAYYPYVATCQEGWKVVPASAPTSQ